MQDEINRLRSEIKNLKEQIEQRSANSGNMVKDLQEKITQMQKDHSDEIERLKMEHLTNT